MSTVPIWTRNVKSFVEFHSDPNVPPLGSPDKRLQAWGIRLKPMLNKQTVKPIGNVYPSAYQSGMEWTDIEAEAGEGGELTVDFNGINFGLATIFGNVAPTNPATGVYKRQFVPTSTPGYLAVDRGDPAQLLNRVLACFFTQMGFAASLNSLTFSASGKGRRIATPVTGAGSVADIALILPNGFRGGIYLNTTFGSLGTPGDVAKIVAGSFLSNFRGLTFNTGTLFDTDTSIKPVNLSWDRAKPLSPTDGQALVTLDGNTNGWSYITQIRNDQTVYGLYEVLGPVLVAGTSEVQTVDLSGGDDPTGGTWTLTILGQTISNLAYNISAADLQTAINILTNNGVPVYGADEVAVTKAGFVYTLNFPAKVGNVAQVTVNSAGLTGGTITVTIATTTAGVAPFLNYFAIEWAGQFPQHFNPAEQEGRSVLELPFGLIQDANLTGLRVTTQCGIADLAVATSLTLAGTDEKTVRNESSKPARTSPVAPLLTRIVSRASSILRAEPTAAVAIAPKPAVIKPDILDAREPILDAADLNLLSALSTSRSQVPRLRRKSVTASAIEIDMARVSY